MEELPVACTLGAGDGAAQLRAWREFDGDYALDRRRTDDGIVIEYAKTTDSVDRLDALVAVERICCALAEWGVDDEGRRLVLTITGPADGLDALHVV